MGWFISIRDWWEERKYPEDVKKIIRLKRDRIRFHKKKIKTIKRHNGSERSLKTHRYLVNRLTRELNGIKEHYKK